MSELFCFLFALLGIVFSLYFAIYKLAVWGERGGIFVIPLYRDDKAASERVRNTLRLLELLGIEKLCTVIIADCGCGAGVMAQLKQLYAKSKRVYFCGGSEISEMCELLGKRFTDG